MRRKNLSLRQNIKFIHPRDPAIDLENSDLESYKENWNFDEHCKLLEGVQASPCLIKAALTLREKERIDGSTFSAGKKGQMNFSPFAHKMAVVRTVLTGIEYDESVPDDEKIPFERENGLVTTSTMEHLCAENLIDDIYLFWTSMQEADSTQLKKSC